MNWQKITIPNYSVRSIASNKDGKIFVGGLNTFGYLKINNIGQLEYVELSAKLDSIDQNFGNIGNIRVIGNKTYFNSLENIYVFDDERLSSLNTGKILYSFAVDNSLYFQKRSNYELYKVVDKGFERISNKEFASKFVMGMNKYRDKIIISTFQNALYLYEGNSIRRYPSEIDQNLKEYKLSNVINFATNSFIFATRRQGIINYNFESKKEIIVNEDNSLQNNNVKSLEITNEKSVWLALNNGISIVNFTPSFQKTNVASRLNSIVDFEDKLILGTFKGLSSLNKETFKLLDLGNIKTTVWDLKKFNNSVVIASEEGIYQLTKSSLRKISTDISSVIHIAKLKPKTILYYSEPVIYLKQFKKNKWQKRKELIKLDAKLSSISENNDGLLWLGTLNKGLYSLNYKNSNDLKLKHYPTFANKTVNVYSFENEVFATSIDFGLYRYNKDTDKFIPETRFGKQFSDGSRSVLRLTKDADGNFTFVSHQHIYQALLQKDGSYKLNSRIFNALPQVQTTAIYADSNKVTWIANEKGLYKYDANIEKDIDLAYPVHISKISLNQDSILFGGFHPIDKDSLTFSIDYAQNQLRFEYAAAYYEMPEKTTYSYKLDGYDKSWSAYSSESFKDYTGLYEGNYTFRVRAKNVYETVSTPESYSFTILAPWYRTWWAYSIYGILFLCGAFAITLWFSNKKLKRLNELRRIETAEAKARETELKSQVEKEQMRARISEDLHDEVGSNLSYIKLMSEVLGDQDSTVKNELFKITVTASESAQAMRDIVWFVSPENDNLEKYIKKLSEVVHKFMEPYTLNFKAEILSEAENLDINMKRNIFLILKEALQNITKHSQASSVDVHILKDDHRFELRIADNGKGFDLTKDTDGNGLKNYKKRAQKIGANFELHSEPNKGTELCLSLTLKA